MQRRFKYVVVLDHHKSSEGVLKDFGVAIFDNNRSGVGITWDSFHPGKTRPNLVSYVEDRDLWRHKLTGSKSIACITEMVPYDFKDWDQYADELDGDLDKVVQSGKAVLSFKDKLVATAAERPRIVRFAGFDVPIVNAMHAIASDLGNKIAQGHPFGIVWRQAADGKFLYSLRSSDDGEDVSVIAARFGGGGHRNAAGFSSNTLIG